MSRSALGAFVHALEHSASLRRQLQRCGTDAEIVALARSLDFAVETVDLRDDLQASAMETWFSRSPLGLRPQNGTD